MSNAATIRERGGVDVQENLVISSGAVFLLVLVPSMLAQGRHVICVGPRPLDRLAQTFRVARIEQ